MPNDGGADSSLCRLQVIVYLKELLERERRRLELSLAAFCSRLGITEETYRRLGSSKNAVRPVNPATLKNMLNRAERAGFSTEAVAALKQVVSHIWLDTEYRAGRICGVIHEHIATALKSTEFLPPQFGARNPGQTPAI